MSDFAAGAAGTRLSVCPVCQKALRSWDGLRMECCGGQVCQPCFEGVVARAKSFAIHPACEHCRAPRPKTPAERLAQLRPRADAGAPDALAALANAFEFGRDGGTKDVARAAALFQQAADQDYAPALFHLSNLYFNGQGVPRDMAKVRGAATSPRRRIETRSDGWNGGSSVVCRRGFVLERCRAAFSR